jgi:hypothetical protein
MPDANIEGDVVEGFRYSAASCRCTTHCESKVTLYAVPKDAVESHACSESGGVASIGGVVRIAESQVTAESHAVQRKCAGAVVVASAHKIRARVAYAFIAEAIRLFRTYTRRWRSYHTRDVASMGDV